MIPRKKVWLAVTLASLFTGLVLSGQALAAAPAYSLTTSPVFLDLPIKPGTSSTSTLQLMNNTTKPVTIMMNLQIFGADGSSGEASIYNAPSNDPSPSWVHFSPSTFIAQPNVWESVKMTITLPTTAQLGYYYAVIFKPVTTQSLTTTGSTIKGSNAILVLVDTQSPNEKRQLQVTNFSATKGIYEYLPATFNVTVANTGNIFLPPSGAIYISKKSNLTDTIATIPVNAGYGNILPSSSRIFQASWSDGFPVFKPKTVDGQAVTNSKGKTVYQLVWNFSSSLSKFRFGKYYAGLALTYNDGKTTKLLTSEVSFWVIPWKLIVIVLVAIVALIVVWIYFKKGIKRLWRKVRRRER